MRTTAFLPNTIKPSSVKDVVSEKEAKRVIKKYLKAYPILKSWIHDHAEKLKGQNKV